MDPEYYCKNLEEKMYMTKDEGVWGLAGEKVKLKEITRIMRVWSQMCTDNLACLDRLVFPQQMDLSLLRDLGRLKHNLTKTTPQQNVWQAEDITAIFNSHFLKAYCFNVTFFSIQKQQTQ